MNIITVYKVKYIIHKYVHIKCLLLHIIMLYCL